LLLPIVKYLTRVLAPSTFGEAIDIDIKETQADIEAQDYDVKAVLHESVDQRHEKVTKLFFF
jgi:hypothetical protein